MGKRYTLCVDYEGVLCDARTPYINDWTLPDPPVPGALHWLWTMVNHFDVVILTTRGRTMIGRWMVREWLRRHSTPTQWRSTGSRNGIDRVFITDRKVPALAYLDDRAMRFDGANFPTRGEIHRARPWNKPKKPKPAAGVLGLTPFDPIDATWRQHVQQIADDYREHHRQLAKDWIDRVPWRQRWRRLLRWLTPPRKQRPLPGQGEGTVDLDNIVMPSGSTFCDDARAEKR